MALTSAQLQEASAVAVQYINKEIPDLFELSNPLYKEMVQRKKNLDQGYTNIQLPIIYQQNQAQGAIAADGSDTISLNPNKVLTYGTLDWKTYYNNVSITQDDLNKAGGSTATIMDIVEAKVNEGKNSFIQLLSTDFYASGATNTKKVNGMADVFAASGTAYAGINNTDVTNWLPLLDSSSQIISYANINNNIQTLNTRGKQFPLDGFGNQNKKKVMVSNSFVLARFMAVEQIKQRYMTTEQLKSGFEGINFNGSIEWVSDGYAPGTADGTTADNYLYILSPESFYLFYRFGFGTKSPMDSTGIIPNTPVQYSVSYWVFNIACSNRRVNCLMSTLKN